MSVAETSWWEQQGYLLGKEIGHGMWICLAPMLFTWRLMLCTPDFVHGFACYDRDNFPLAMEAFTAWEVAGLPLVGYTRAVHLGERP